MGVRGGMPCAVNLRGASLTEIENNFWMKKFLKFFLSGFCKKSNSNKFPFQDTKQNKITK